MIDDVFVIDAVAHAYNFNADNFVSGSRHIAEPIAQMLYHGVHGGFSPRGQPRWLMKPEDFGKNIDPGRLAHAFFAESQTDFVVYHEVPLWGLFKDGGSPIAVGKAMRDRYPGRVAVYGALSPLVPGWAERIERLVEEDGVAGFKFYPTDIIDGKAAAFRFDDPALMFPVIEAIARTGIKNIAVHKAMPQGPVPLEPFRPDDVAAAAAAFPDISFEIVHGGFAFLEETALLLASFPNVSVNLEGTTAFLINHPRKFAEIVGTLMLWGGDDRIIWATGCNLLHPRPFIEAFWSLELPQDLIEGQGFPPLTADAKRKILGLNQARLLGLDVATLAADPASAAGGARPSLAEPWSG